MRLGSYVSRRSEFRERLGELLPASEVCCAGLAYSVALAGSRVAYPVELVALLILMPVTWARTDAGRSMASAKRALLRPARGATAQRITGQHNEPLTSVYISEHAAGEGGRDRSKSGSAGSMALSVGGELCTGVPAQLSVGALGVLIGDGRVVAAARRPGRRSPRPLR
ncbi:DUF6000 family protein [Streptomyces rochei]|uniref:DUF6000 family protein n=1 Tax=Streptomyces rochei TaxID=1928 RepID=UPI0036C7F5EA